MNKFRNSLALLLLPATMAMAGCAADTGDAGSGQCSGAKCDSIDDLDVPDSDVEDSPCDGFVVDHSGRGHQKVAGRLGDPFAMKVLRAGDDCPTSLEDIMDKLRTTDTENCDSESDPRAGLKTRVVSETAQPLGEATNYRAVVTRRCDGRKEHDLTFSLFGLQAGDESLPQDGIEVIAFDESAGVFNYYKTSGGRINWFGNSFDMLRGPSGEDRECATCHVDGGLIMKELDTPWLHWEGHMDVPGAGDLVEGHEDLGTKASGSNMESLVKAGNRAWNESRVELLKSRGMLDEMLRPLFCDMSVNLDNGADFESPVEGGEGGDEVDRVPFDAMFDKQLKGFGGIDIEFAEYDRIIKENGQTIQGISGSVDTVFDMVFVERGFADDNFVAALKTAGILDDEFIKDVLMVDFTRHVFSDDRCDLLQFAPAVAADDLGPEALRDGFIENLTDSGASAGDGTPAGQLLANLQSTGGHGEVVDAFIDTCKARPNTEFLADQLALISKNRNLARRLHMFEFAQTMPVDDLNTPDEARLDPTTCEMTNSYTSISIGTETAEPTADNSCEVRGCTFLPEASCQCNDLCEDAGDCCEDFEAVCQ